MYVTVDSTSAIWRETKVTLQRHKASMLKDILDCPTHSLPLVDRSLWCFGVIEVKILNACFRGLCFLRALNIYGWLSSISMQR